MSTYDNLQSDTREQLARLQKQVQDLLGDRVRPALSEARDRAGEVAGQLRGYAGQARDATSEGADAVAGQVRDQPLLAIGVAAAVGFLLGRITR